MVGFQFRHDVGDFIFKSLEAVLFEEPVPCIRNAVDMGEGIGPAIRSGLLAAEAILHDGDYDVGSIARVSLLPSPRRFIDAVGARRP